MWPFTVTCHSQEGWGTQSTSHSLAFPALWFFHPCLWSEEKCLANLCCCRDHRSSSQHRCSSHSSSSSISSSSSSKHSWAGGHCCLLCHRLPAHHVSLYGGQQEGQHGGGHLLVISLDVMLKLSMTMMMTLIVWMMLMTISPGCLLWVCSQDHCEGLFWGWQGGHTEQAQWPQEEVGQANVHSDPRRTVCFVLFLFSFCFVSFFLF